MNVDRPGETEFQTDTFARGKIVTRAANPVRGGQNLHVNAPIPVIAVLCSEHIA